MLTSCFSVYTMNYEFTLARQHMNVNSELLFIGIRTRIENSFNQKWITETRKFFLTLFSRKALRIRTAVS